MWRWPWWPSSVKYGRRPMAHGEPISDDSRGPWRPSSHRAKARAGWLAGFTSWPSTMSMSRARQTVWLEIRVVPLTLREWPVCRQLSRMAWRSAITATSDWTRRSSRPEARSALGLQPWLVVVVIRGLVTRARTNGSLDGAGGGAEEV